MDQVRLLLIDDHELIRNGLGGVLDLEDDLTVVGSAATVTEGIAAFERTNPDVVVTDLQLPDGTGLDVIRAVRAQVPDVGVVVLTMHSGDDQIFGALQAGASALVGKDAPASDVVQAVRHAMTSPHSFVSAGLGAAMARRMDGGTERLTDRELDVLRLLADGLGAADIGRRLYMAESTAKTHIARIYQKLGAANRAQAIVQAVRAGLISSMNRPEER
ncbi:DNA-binding response regulator [Nocardioides baekrokdamisoli]|uniref:DNA-binding response regulator n=1 Tax=Nocardioides baekrokdamisoli TaxID=1804624 RepID=A0A3G9IJE3_9ACTN|nr:response regulator transcription factor [Nocardioides baekrokdamisoli]BBH18292.1 DNA-binding response regulator [Nocardioides baekrokdamisoli]